MIVSAAVKIKDLRQNGKEITIRCHRHCDVFEILHLFGYKPQQDYEEVEQGFLDEHDKFYNRVDAYVHAVEYGQLVSVSTKPQTLYSEDLY